MNLAVRHVSFIKAAEDRGAWWMGSSVGTFPPLRRCQVNLAGSNLLNPVQPQLGV